MSSATGVTPEPRAIARIALIGLSETDTSFLADCFRQFKLQTVSVADQPENALKKDKFAGCVIPLVNGAEEVLRAARQSPSNRHMILYGIAPDPHAAMKFSDFGINVVFKQPLERSAALRVVRSTYLLALHEYRRYVRVPVATEVVVDSGKTKINALSEEISNGGMSVYSDNLLPGASAVKVSFSLPEKGKMTIAANICWRRESEGSFGLQFFADDPNRHLVRQWIDNFLELE